MQDAFGKTLEVGHYVVMSTTAYRNTKSLKYARVDELVSNKRAKVWIIFDDYSDPQVYTGQEWILQEGRTAFIIVPQLNSDGENNG